MIYGSLLWDMLPRISNTSHGDRLKGDGMDAQRVKGALNPLLMFTCLRV